MLIVFSAIYYEFTNGMVKYKVVPWPITVSS